MKTLLSSIILVLTLSSVQYAYGQNYELTQSKIKFLSDAPLESIEAESNKLKGIMNLSENRFAFSIDILSFQGFNSALQKEHFNESYMESDKYPRSTFSGKLIDKFNPSLSFQKVRAKGIFEIHGVQQERIIEVEITKENDKYKIRTEFNLLLSDHGISVPRVVHQKISETVVIIVSGVLTLK